VSSETAPRKSFDWRGLVVPVLLIVAAQAAAVVTHLQSDSLAAPSEILAAGIEALSDGTVLRATRDTLIMALAGLAIGVSIGLFLGLLLGLSRVADRLMEFSIEAFRPIPSVALIPVAMLVYGFGYRMEISIVAFATTWPMLLFTRSAVGSIEPRLMEVSRALGFGMLARVWKIILPAALPRIFVAFRLAVGIALIVAVTVEIAANPYGLGYAMMVAQQSLRPGLMFAILIWIGLVGWFMNVLMIWAQHRLFGPAAVTAVQL
jgi:ABC-type nitrate/sulfonate/bicarbonate transport system permease component